MWRLWMVLAIGCAPPIVTGPAIAPSTHLVVVAHQDDDLIFLQSDLDDAIARGESVTIVYVTQGLASESAAKITSRLAGSEAAYTHLAHSDAWQCGWIEIAGLAVDHCRLQDRPLSLVYLGYPDGGKDGEQPDSLLHLWEGSIASTTTIGALTSSITRDQLVAEVAALVTATSPRWIHTQDLGADHGRDHVDHVMVGALTAVALARAGSTADVLAVRGYNTPLEQPNKLDGDYDRGASLLGYFMACFEDCDACGTASCASIDPSQAEWLHRRYAIARRHLPLAGQLANDAGQCLLAIADHVGVGDCGSAPTWRLDHDGSLRADDGRCVIAPGGTLGICDRSAAQYFLFDDDGVLWSGLVPAIATDDAHLACLAGETTALCGGDQPTVHWTIGTPPTTTDLAALGMTSMPLTLGDVGGSPAGDLCAATSAGVRCALGLGDGTFGSAVWLHGDGAPLIVEPATLRLGDVDGDGRADACGRHGDQIVCALAAEQFESPRAWLDVDATFDDATMSIDRGQVCAREGTHAMCSARSATPTQVADIPPGPLWIADLDGDGVLDYCTADANGPACARASTGMTTTPWSFSLNGIVDGSLAADSAILDPTRAVLADVDGDGLPDLCRLATAGVACASNQRTAFGPAHLIAPGGDLLVTGDLDGDGRADLCTVTGTTLACTRSP